MLDEKPRRLHHHVMIARNNRKQPHALGTRTYFIRIDDHYMISHVLAGLKGWFVFALENGGHLRREPSNRLPLGIHQMPTTLQIATGKGHIIIWLLASVVARNAGVNCRSLGPILLPFAPCWLPVVVAL